jgi:hypothetical protein
MVPDLSPGLSSTFRCIRALMETIFVRTQVLGHNALLSAVDDGGVGVAEASQVIIMPSSFKMMIFTNTQIRLLEDAVWWK